MRRIITWLLSTISALVLLFSYHTSTSSSAPIAATAPVAPAPVVTPKTTAGTSTTKTVAGSVVPTRFGNVQVQITVAGGRITAVGVLQIPNRDRKDVEINNRAVPVLNAAAVAKQSATIDAVSGATVTSTAYKQSLQAAIDAAFG